MDLTPGAIGPGLSDDVGIAVWIKLTGPKGTTAGFDWIKLQDLSLPAPE